jgi:hypothetical protein
VDVSPEEMRSEAYKANSGGNAAKYVSQRQSIFYSNLVLEKRDHEFFQLSWLNENKSCMGADWILPRS